MIKKIKRILKQGGKKLLYEKIVNKFRNILGLNEISKKQIKKLIGSNPQTILEIGAADGKDSMEFLKCFKSSKIFLFEPDPRNVNILIKKFSNNKNIFIEKFAISDKNGETTFYQSMKEDVLWAYSSSIKKPKNHFNQFPDIKFNKSIKVKTKTLDDWSKENKIDCIDFIWADVQGAEKEMIIGGMETLNNKTKYFYTEYSNNNLYENEISLNEIKELLTNFEIVKIFGTKNSIYGNVLFKNKKIK